MNNGVEKRVFNYWLATFRDSINGYGYYTDFEKVYENANSLKVEINMLNSLIGSKNIEKDFADLVTKYRSVIKAIPILLAVRQKEIFCQDQNGAVVYRFDKMIQSVEQYSYFMRETGLFDMLENHIISNLFDYVTGVEVGLGSNGRKNRGGHQMEDLVESFIKETGVTYYKEMNLSAMEKKWGIDLSAISANGTTEKRWDFVVKTNDTIYVIETNFYTGSGSKLNETARSYKMIAEEAKKVAGLEFIWITDGAGWLSTKNLEETFQVMDNLYNIKDMEDGIFDRLFKNK